MKKILLIIFVSMLTCAVQAQASLDPWLIAAGKNNPGVKASFEAYLAALEKVPQVKSLPDPMLAFGYFLMPVETRTGPQQFKLSANQLFPWFGKLKAAESVAEDQARVAYELFEETKSRLYRDIRSVYASLYLNQKFVEITRRNLDILNTFQQMVWVRIQTGQSGSADDIRIRIESGDLENQLALLKDRQAVWWVQFDQLVQAQEAGHPEIPVQLESQLMELPEGSLWDSVTARNHQLLKLDMEQLALQSQAKVAELAGKPDFSLGIEYMNMGVGDGSFTGKDALVFPMVGIRIPLYREKYEAKVREVVHRQQAKENEKLDRQEILYTIHSDLTKDLADARRRMDLFERQYNLTQEVLDLLISEFATGRTDFEELLRIQRKLLGYEWSLEKARADEWTTTAWLKYLIGK